MLSWLLCFVHKFSHQEFSLLLNWLRPMAHLEWQWGHRWQLRRKMRWDWDKFGQSEKKILTIHNSTTFWSLIHSYLHALTHMYGNIHNILVLRNAMKIIGVCPFMDATCKTLHETISTCDSALALKNWYLTMPVHFWHTTEPRENVSSFFWYFKIIPTSQIKCFKLTHDKFSL